MFRKVYIKCLSKVQNVYKYMHCVIMKLKVFIVHIIIAFYYFTAVNLVAYIKFCCDVRTMEPFLQLIAVILYIAEYVSLKGFR